MIIILTGFTFTTMVPKAVARHRATLTQNCQGLATGDNSNPLMQPYVMPDPIVADASKIPATTLPTTYLYDIPTTAGQEVELIDAAGTAAIYTFRSEEQILPTSTQAYALDGRRVDSSYKGLVIVGGRKMMMK